ncbi:hypothetical protein BASA50_008033 [Batrachochytrium salamandrivorans]|uniref:COI1 F-box domain-containing protein n=1 Tax=Batrachochytrium salamandrivorans TaxID=1357716 RepID=A0ABQ8F535_9FUNG|nr:hypothetical protein BASA50_008033 [Batrachochytrium salamandrivorans]KAH9275715.1 hypothetical protein BASA83_002017 [Batrachochytrium salamandrivorans]
MVKDFRSRSWHGQHVSSHPHSSDADDSSSDDEDDDNSDYIDLTSPSIESANFFSATQSYPTPLHSNAHATKTVSAMKSRRKRDSGSFATSDERRGRSDEKTRIRPKSWMVNQMATSDSSQQAYSNHTSFIGNAVSRVPSWMQTEQQGPRAMWASMKHDNEDELPMSMAISPQSPIHLPTETQEKPSLTQRRRSVRWSDMSNFSFNASHLPGAILKCIMSLAQNPAEISSSYMLVCQQWSRAGARVLYANPMFRNMAGFQGMIRTLMNPVAFHPYPAFVLHFHIPTMISDQLLIGDIDVALQLFPNLESISLQSCPSASNIVIQSLSDHSPDLVKLNMAGCPISDAFLPDLFRHSPSLQSINLTGTKITIATLICIIDLCKEIEHICLDGALPDSSNLTFHPLTLSSPTRPLKSLCMRNSSITDLSLRYVTSHCPELRRVILDGSSGISDDSIVALALASSHLEVVQLAFCSFVTDVSLYALAKHASHSLKRVALAGCEEVSEQGIMHMVRKCSIMQELHLHGCSQILKSFIASYHSGDRHLGVECLIRGDSLRLLAKHKTNVHVATAHPITLAAQDKLALSQDYRSAPSTLISIPTPISLSPTGSSQRNASMIYNTDGMLSPLSTHSTTVDVGVQTEVCVEGMRPIESEFNRATGDLGPTGAMANSSFLRRSFKSSHRRKSRSNRSQRSSHRRKRGSDDDGSSDIEGAKGLNSKGHSSGSDTEGSSDYYDESREAMDVLKKFAKALTSSAAAAAAANANSAGPGVGGLPPAMSVPAGGYMYHHGAHLSAMQHAAMAANGMVTGQHDGSLYSENSNGAGAMHGAPWNMSSSQMHLLDGASSSSINSVGSISLPHHTGYKEHYTGNSPYMHPNASINRLQNQVHPSASMTHTPSHEKQDAVTGFDRINLGSRNKSDSVLYSDQRQAEGPYRSRAESHSSRSSGSSNGSGGNRWSVRSSTSSNLSVSRLPLPSFSRPSSTTPTPPLTRTVSSRLPVGASRTPSSVPKPTARLRSNSIMSDYTANTTSRSSYSPQGAKTPQSTRPLNVSTPPQIDTQLRKHQPQSPPSVRALSSGYGPRSSSSSTLASVGNDAATPVRSFVKKAGPLDTFTRKSDMNALHRIQQKSVSGIRTPGASGSHKS